ncbi:unnamed protein product (macronuclear) [Paramecium tetraurelia]|uniref:Uncharacterized protein n=1 Tax=Paramecium tetraurelia TaxID=5888 RepID=A0C6Y1_PARTE|nr:uncharacterized protein GSPATT00035677001 [Paramecium tetraurelia]CAK66548.1 unnamed protein product [Paramecium tetraurelia]|eukprot:XP_001433945.1 hypothetical protein (macronuclear) [Paramecium tetraurelia strain d4-2]
MSANDLSKPESLDNLSQPSSQEGQQRKQYKVHRLGNRKQSSNQNYYIKEQASSREERKLKSYLQRIEEQQKLEEAALLKRKRSKPNQETKSSETQEGPKQIDEVIMPIQATVLLNPLLVPQQSQLDVTAQSKLRLNPKLKIKEKHHIFLYLSEWYDRCVDNMQKLNSGATQQYSPQKVGKCEVTNIQSINQDVYQDTLILMKNFKHQYQQQNGNDSKELLNRYSDRKFLESILKDNKQQINKKNGLEKVQISNGKFNQKKN